MRIEARFSAAEVDPASLAGAVAVVIDVIRATTTILEAIAAGASAVYPASSVGKARRLASELGPADSVLGGERRGLRIGGFDLGNSPREYTRESVKGRNLVLTTTNGTRALVAARTADRVLVAALTNLSAVSRVACDAGRVVLVCAGKEDRFALDDVLCAGMIIEQLVRTSGTEPVLDDASRAAVALAGCHEVTPALLREVAAGVALVDVGLEADLDLCAEIDRHDIVPEMTGRTVSLPG